MLQVLALVIKLVVTPGMTKEKALHIVQRCLEAAARNELTDEAQSNICQEVGISALDVTGISLAYSVVKAAAMGDANKMAQSVAIGVSVKAAAMALAAVGCNIM